MAGPITCPRCDYDLQGVVSTWIDQCPTTGVCTECGLGFAWRDVLHPSYLLPRWMVEARRPIRAWPMQVLGSVVRALRPAHYWKSIGMHQPVRWHRLLGYGATLMLILLLPVHLSTIEQAFHDHQDMASRTTSTVTEGKVLFHSLLRPFSQRSAGGYSYSLPDGTISTYRGAPPVEFWMEWLEVWPLWMPILVTPITVMMVFMVLPQSRRRAKVRWRHIARVTLHSSAVPFLALLLVAAGFTVNPRGPIGPPNALHALAVIFLPLATLLWWRAAVRHYLRMEHSWAVALSATVVGLQIPLTIAMAIVYW